MCQAIKFTINNHPILFCFSDNNPCLPVLTRNGNIVILPWGNQSQTLGLYPEGATAHIVHVQSDKWKSHQPKSVRIACEAFMMVDQEGNEHWFDTQKSNQYIRGVVATQPLADKVYVLMRNRDLLEPDISHEWPVK
ncbi:MAG TPA: hypothetical protein ENI26_13140 [Methylophaga aminisulfidivorans]|uniref:Uncharacterized protein n=2 Tax=root TaxID=1 RepID=A0A7C1W543_9GAMM|nr:hypothetical protein [Methylophaga aminisulfidivorans]